MNRYTLIYIYIIHIFIRFAYGTPVKSHKVQLEARHSSNQSDFERDFEGKTSMTESACEAQRSILESASEGQQSMLEQCFRALSGLEARSSSDLECSVARKHVRAVISNAQWPRRKKKHARAVISSAQWLRSTFEQ